VVDNEQPTKYLGSFLKKLNSMDLFEILIQDVDIHTLSMQLPYYMALIIITYKAF